MLGLATGFYAYPSLPASANPGIIQNLLQKGIISKQEPYTNLVSPFNVTGGYGYYHGVVAINFYNGAFNWNSNIATLANASQVDLYTVMFHELVHALGFASLISGTGISKFGAANNYYSVYDKYLQDKNGNSLIVSSNTCNAQYGHQFSSSAAFLAPGCNANYISDITVCNTACRYSSSLLPNMPVYTPACFEPPSSLSHFEDMCYPTPNVANNNMYFTMSNALSSGVNKRNLKPEERFVLCDLGYNVSNTYTSLAVGTSTTYPGGACSTASIWGQNDGIVNGAYTYTSTGAAITISIATGNTPIIGNDAVPAVVSASCIESVYNNGIVSTNYNTGIITFQPNAGYVGPFLLRYIPVSIGTSSLQGNVTYIFGYVFSNDCNPASACNIIQNGTFESNVNCGSTVSNSTNTIVARASCWYPYTLSPDLYVRGCTSSSNPTLSMNLGSNTSSSIAAVPSAFNSWNGQPNNAIIGLGGAYIGGLGDFPFVESYENMLGTPLVNGQTYILSFWANQFSGSKTDPENNLTQAINSSSVPLILNFCGSTGFLAPSTSQTYPTTNITSFATVPLANVFNSWRLYTTIVTCNTTNALNWFYLGIDKAQMIPQLLALNQASAAINFYVLIDDVSIEPLNQVPQFNLPSTVICSNQSISNLIQFVSLPTGTFSGTGVTATGTGTNTVYNFNQAGTLAAGVYNIVYSYTNNVNCVKTLIKQITISNYNNGISLNVVQPLNCFSNHTVTASAPGFTVFNWQPSAQTGTSISLSVTVPITLTVQATSTTGCLYQNTVSLLPTTPVFSLASSAPSAFACPGAPLILYAYGNFTNAVWAPGNLTGNSVTVTPISNTIYTVTAYSALGCALTKTMQVAVSTLTTAVAVNSTTNCSGAFTLSAQGFNPGSTIWVPGTYTAPSIVVTPTSNTTYIVQGNDANGCLRSNTVVISPPYQLQVSGTGTTCGSSQYTLQASGNFTSIVWQPGGFTVNPLVVTLPNYLSGPPTINYTATVTYSNGCTRQLVYTINILDYDPKVPEPVLTYPVLCSGGSETLSIPNGAGTATWLPMGVTGSCVVSPTQNTTYTVVVTNTMGCVFIKTVQVVVSNSCCTNPGTIIKNMTVAQQTLSGTQILNGTLTIPPNSILTLDGEFIMNPNAKIIVPQSSTLLIRNSHLYSCSSMWAGIEVQNGGTVKMDKITKSNLIEDAITAIKSYSAPSTISITSTTFNRNYISIDISNSSTIVNYPLTVRSSVFTSRLLAFNATQWPQTGVTSNNSGMQADLRYTNVNINAVLAPPYFITTNAALSNLKIPYTAQPSQIAIRVSSGAVGTNFTIGDASNSSNFNLFDGQGTCIEATNCNLNSYNNTFQNTRLFAGAFNSGIRSENNYANSANMNTALNLVSSTTPSLNINRFYDCHVAVEARNQASVNIQWAQISSTQSNPQLAALSAQGYFGVYIRSNRFHNYQVNKNSIYNVNTGVYALATADWVSPSAGTYGQSWGTFMVASNTICPGAGLNAVLNNEFINEAVRIETAIKVANASSILGSSNFDGWPTPPISSYTLSPNNGIKVIDNRMSKVFNGVYIGNFYYTGFSKTTANNAILLKQKTGTNVTQRGVNHTNNYLSVINSNTVAGFSSASNFSVAGIYNTLNPSGSTQCNSVVAVPRGFEFYQTNRPHYWRGNVMNDNSFGLYANAWGTSSLGGIAAQGSTTLASDNFWQGIWSTSKLQTYTDQNSSAANSKLFTHPSPAGYTLNFNWNDGNITSNSYKTPSYSYSQSTGAYFQCGTVPPGGTIPRDWRDIPPDSLNFSDPTFDVSRFMLFLALNDDSLFLANGGDTLQSFYEANLPMEYGQIVAIEAALASGQYTMASTLLASFSPTNTVQENYANFFTAYLHSATNGSLSYTDAQNLLMLAYQCPATDGPAVYKARALYNDLYKTILEFNDDNCVPEGFALRSGSSDALLQVSAASLIANEKTNKLQNQSYTIYPNPSHGMLYIGNAKPNEQMHLIITDLSGRVVSDRYVKCNDEGKSIQNLDFSNGVYFVSLEGAKCIIKRKIILNK